MIVRRKSGLVFAVVMLTGLFTTGCGPAPSSTVSQVADVRRDATVAAIEQALPSVVNIATTTIVERAGDPAQEMLRRFFGWPVTRELREEPYNIGSGVIIDEEGYLLTNLHVLDRAEKVLVKLWNGEVYEARQRVGTSQKDVALLQIIAPAGTKFQAMKFAHDDDLLLGETVIALGNPYGLGGSVSRGILSSKNRRLTSANQRLDFPDWLQTDADINPGNSGGPLINLRGEMIGINGSVYREGLGMGVGFAIPVKQIAAALADFFTPEAANAVWFGARVASFNPPLTITSVQPRSPAEQAGLRPGQHVLQVNGRRPHDLVDFHRLLTADAKNLNATIQVEANGQRRSLNIRLIAFQELIQQRLGVSLRNLTPPDAALVGIKAGEGVLIEQVEKDSPADHAKLQAGFLLVRVDDRKTGTLLHAADALSTKQAGDQAKLSFVVPRSFGPGAGEYHINLTVR